MTSEQAIQLIERVATAVELFGNDMAMPKAIEKKVRAALKALRQAKSYGEDNAH